MITEFIYSLAADVMLVLHALLIGFVVFGLIAIYLGLILSWGWVRNFWFRLLHLAVITYVVLQSWAGAICPLTIWEMQLRELAGEESYEGSFIQHWLHTLLFFEAPGWVFVVVYTGFGSLVAASWFIVPPKRVR